MPATWTLGRSTPATTCALVSTCRGETTKPDPSRVRLHCVGGPADLHHAGGRAAHGGRAGDAGRRRVDVADLLGRQAAEHRRQRVVVEDLAEGGEQRAGAVGHHLVDTGDHPRVADLAGQRRQRTGVQRRGEEPGDHQHRDHADRRAEAGVDHSGRSPGQPVAQQRPEPAQRHLADGRRHQDDRDREQRLAEPGLQRGDQPRRDQQAHHAAGEEAGKRQHTDDEALPVAGERERERRDDQDEVEPVHPRPASLGSASGGSGRTCDRSHGCSQPASRSIRSSRPAVKPHTSRPAASKAHRRSRWGGWSGTGWPGRAAPPAAPGARTRPRGCPRPRPATAPATSRAPVSRRSRSAAGTGPATSRAPAPRRSPGRSPRSPRAARRPPRRRPPGRRPRPGRRPVRRGCACRGRAR